MHTSTVLYSGSADGARFTVPEDSLVTYFNFRAKEGLTLSEASFTGEAGTTALKLEYSLLPGFIANRMQHALWREAISIVERGIADAETVDKAVKYAFGLRLPQLGPITNSDMVGTQLTYNIHDYILKDLEDSHEPSPLLKQMLDEGKLGFKSGEGFMKWTPEQIAKENADLNEYLIRMLYGK